MLCVLFNLKNRVSEIKSLFVYVAGEFYECEMNLKKNKNATHVSEVKG